MEKMILGVVTSPVFPGHHPMAGPGHQSDKYVWYNFEYSYWNEIYGLGISKKWLLPPIFYHARLWVQTPNGHT